MTGEDWADELELERLYSVWGYHEERLGRLRVRKGGWRCDWGLEIYGAVLVTYKVFGWDREVCGEGRDLRGMKSEC